MRGRTIGAIVGVGFLLLCVALGFAALPQIGAAQEYAQAVGWLDLKLDGLSLYFALLGLSTLGLALLAGRWAAVWQALPLAATYLLVRSYSLGEWPLWLRLVAEAGAAVVMIIGLELVLRSRRFIGQGGINPAPTLADVGAGFIPPCLPILLISWGMVALAVCSAEPSAVAGGLLLAAAASWLGLAVSGAAGRDKSRPYNQTIPPGDAGRDKSRPYNFQLSTFNFQLSAFNLLQLPGLWLYLHAMLARGELLYAALMLVGVAGIALGLLRLRPHAGWLNQLLAALSVAGFAGGAMLIDGLLRPALAGLTGLPAWGALKVQRLDLPAPQPNAAVGVGLKVASDISLLPLLALTLAFGFALALGWLLYRLLSALARAMRHE